MSCAAPHEVPTLQQRAQAWAQAPTPAFDALLAAWQRAQAHEAELGAFACLADEALLRRQAIGCAGPLAGVAVGVKDIFDTRDLPTAYGAPMVYPAVPARQDAAIVAALRRAGACIVGKTTTTEFAFLHPTATRNPSAPGRTPGGSSAGSAAAVAAGVIPLAVGTQTGGSVIRPASYCGAVGYKPTAGWLPTAGLKCFSWSLDTVGLFTRSVADMCWSAQALAGRSLGPAAMAEASRAFVIGVPEAYPWGEPSPGMRVAVARAAEALREAGHEVRRVALPPVAMQAFDAHAEVQGWEATTALAWEVAVHRAALSTELREYLDDARAITADAYERAQGVAAAARLELAAWLGGCDVLLTPAAAGEAPVGYASTGASTFNRLWTLLGWPCVSVPGLTGEQGAPLGMQLIGRAGDDARVLEVAVRLEAALRT